MDPTSDELAAAPWRWGIEGGAEAVFTSRAEGSVAGAESRGSRAAASSLIGLEPSHVAHVRQVHGASVWLDLGAGSQLPDDVRWDSSTGPTIEADALVTTRRDVALAIVVADCMPIIVEWGDAIAAIHAGWRSLAGGVIEAAMHAMRRAAGDSIVFEGVTPRAVIGPSLRSCCFEVGEEVAARFDASCIHRPVGAERPMLDAQADAARRLRALGCEVDTVRICTACDPRLFSHRASGGSQSRQAGLVRRAI